MTETVTATPRGGNATPGITVPRVFTTAGVHPYDEVVWEQRDVVQTNWKTGEVVFEQRGVEFPEFWSVNASTIVTTKYFRGALGTDQRVIGQVNIVEKHFGEMRIAGEINDGAIDEAALDVVVRVEPRAVVVALDHARAR